MASVKGALSVADIEGMIDETKQRQKLKGPRQTE